MKWLKRLFCLHYWKRGTGIAWFEDGCPFMSDASLFSQGDIWHCSKCGKYKRFVGILPVNYIEGHWNNGN